jgi:NAD(P)-dependent dehydrogenase (short-subunit alcohol dehydrogenase family)
MAYEISLEGKNALITGAGRGIGKAAAIAFAKAGANIVIVSRNIDELNQTRIEIEKCGKKALPIVCDMGDIKQVRAMANNAIKEYKHIDLLLNIAGINRISPAFEVTEKDWDDVMNVNVKGPYFLSQIIGRHMMENGIKGSIINCTSECQDIVETDLGAYCPSKAALKMITKVLAVEWGKYGIRVNALAPSFINTTMNTPLIEGATENLKTFFDTKLKRVPMCKYGEPEDLISGFMFLASDQSSYVTGTSIIIDGGYTAC